MAKKVTTLQRPLRSPYGNLNADYTDENDNAWPSVQAYLDSVAARHSTVPPHMVILVQQNGVGVEMTNENQSSVNEFVVKAQLPELAPVATSGRYEDLLNKPTIADTETVNALLNASAMANNIITADVSLPLHGYISQATHQFVDTTGDDRFECSGFVYVRGFKKIDFSARSYSEAGDSCQMCFYDSSRNVIPALDICVNDGITQTIDLTSSTYANVYYIVMSAYLPGWSSGKTYLRVNGEDAQTGFAVSLTSTEDDLNIGDSYGNSLIEIGEDIKTKNFDSSKTASISLDNSDNILNIGDPNGNVILGIDSMGKITSKSIKLFPKIGSPINYIPNDIESGGTVFDNVESLYNAFDDLVENNPRWIKRESDIGLDESGNYTMRHYTVCNQYASICSDRAGDNTNQWNDNLYQRRRILINLSVHSNEKYATLAGYLMIKEIIESNDDWAMFIKCNTVLDIVPCCNPYGLDNNSAYNVNGVNLNRGYDEGETAEQEVKNMKSLINNLLQKGLIGIIDFHNTGVGEAYIIARKDYTRFSWFAVLTQSIEALLGTAFSDVFSSSQHTNHMHLWTYESEANSIGQLHWYANKIGILGTTIEVSTGAGTKGSRLEKAIGINLINSYINY